MFRSALLSLAMIATIVQPLLAACADQAIPELRRGTPVTILRADSTVTRATFLRAERDPVRLVLEQRSGHRQRNVNRLTLATSDMLRIEAPGRRFSNQGWLVAGAGGGMLAGMLLASLLAKTKELPQDPGADVRFAPGPRRALAGPTTTRDVKLSEGGVLGMGIGTILGLVLSSRVGPARSWSCPERPDPPGDIDSTAVPAR